MQRAANESKMYASDYVYSHARKPRGPKGGLEHADKCTEIYVVEGIPCILYSIYLLPSLIYINRPSPLKAIVWMRRWR